jgi:hypothetical protein
MSKINIIVIENESSLVQNIKTEILKSFKEQVNVLPEFIDESTEDFRSKNFLMDRLEKGEKAFAEIVAFCAIQKVRLFFIDIRLLADNDEIGLQFAGYLLEHYLPDYSFEVVVMSNFFADAPLGQYSNVKFMKKYDGREFIPITATDEVDEFLKRQGIIPKNAEKPEAVKGNVRYNQNKLRNSYVEQCKRWIDSRIHETFLLIILALVLNAIIGIGCFIWNLSKHEIVSLVEVHEVSAATTGHVSAKVTQLSAEALALKNAADLSADMIVLKITEHVFLYLLPLFITFGFMNYYINNISIFLLGGEISSLRSKNSTSTIDLTKIMFISSIISYIIIKIIELVCMKGILQYHKFFALTGILLILIVYFMLLYKHKRDE